MKPITSVSWNMERGRASNGGERGPVLEFPSRARKQLCCRSKRWDFLLVDRRHRNHIAVDAARNFRANRFSRAETLSPFRLQFFRRAGVTHSVKLEDLAIFGLEGKRGGRIRNRTSLNLRVHTVP